jgi:hypothetical protein
MDPGIRRDDMAIVICPTGCFAICVSTPVSKNILLRVLVEAALLIPPSHPSEGRIAIVTDAGRDAVDAAAPGAHQRADEWRNCGRQSRVVLTPRRWRQVGGLIRKRRWQESPVTGESTK